MIFAKNYARFYEKKILGTSYAWSTIHLSHWPSKPAYYNYFRLTYSDRLRVLKTIYFHFCDFIKKMKGFLQRI